MRKFNGFRNIRVRGFLREYYGSHADNREDNRIPIVRLSDHILIEGAWGDQQRENRFRKIWKEKRLTDRRRDRKNSGRS